MNFAPYQYGYTPSFAPQQYTPATPNATTFACRPVTSRLEAEAVPVDFMNAGTVMPDLAHGCVYIKRFNPNTGASDFLVFTAQQVQEPSSVQYATIQDLNALREELLKGKENTNAES